MPPPTSPEFNAKALEAEHAEELLSLNEKNSQQLQRLQSEMEGKDTLQIEVDKLRHEIEALQKSLTEAHGTIKQEKDTKEGAKADLARSNADLASKLSDLQAHVRSLSDSHKNDQARAQTKIIQLEAEIENHKTLSKDLLQESEGAEVKSNNFEELVARNKALEEEKFALIEAKSAMSDNAFSEARNVKDELSHLQQQLEENLKAKESEIDVHQKQLTEANMLRKNLQSEKDEKDSELLSINKVVEELQTEVQRLLQANSDASRAADGLQEDLNRSEERYSAELQGKESQANNLKDTVNRLKKDIRDLQQQKTLREEKDEREISDSQSEVDILQKKVAEAGQKMNEMQIEKDTETRELMHVIEGLQHNIKTLKQHGHDAERLAKEENEKIRQETFSLREQFEGEVKGKDEQSKEIKGKLTALTASMADIEKANSQLKEEQEKMKTERISEIQQLRRANKEMLMNSESEIKSLKDETIKLKDEIKILELAKNVAEERMTANKEEAASLQKVLETFDKDSKEREQQQSTALNKASADLQLATKGHQAELHKLRDEHADELSKVTESLKTERDNRLKELQARYDALSTERQKVGEEQTSLVETTKTELEKKHEKELSDLQTRHDTMTRINEELAESSTATQKLLEDELKKVRTEFDNSKAKQDEAHKIDVDNLVNLQDRLDSISSEKQKLLDTQNKICSKMQEDHELVLKRLTEDFDHQVATLRKEQSSNQTLVYEKVALEQTVNDLEARCAQLKSSADMAVILEEQSKLLKPRIHELEGEVASLNAELKASKKPEMESLPGTRSGLSGDKWSVSAENADDIARNANTESSTPNMSTIKAEIGSKGNKIDDAPSNGEWSPEMSLEGTVRLPFFYCLLSTFLTIVGCRFNWPYLNILYKHLYFCSV